MLGPSDHHHHQLLPAHLKISLFLCVTLSSSLSLFLSLCSSSLSEDRSSYTQTHTHRDTHFIWITALLRYRCNNLNNSVWSSVLCRAGPDREGFSPFNSENVRGCRCPLPTGTENSSLLSPAWLQWYVRHCPKCWFIALITLLGYCPGKDSTTSHIQRQGAGVCMSVLVGCFLCTGLSIKHAKVIGSVVREIKKRRVVWKEIDWEMDACEIYIYMNLHVAIVVFLLMEQELEGRWSVVNHLQYISFLKMETQQGELLLLEKK